MSYSLPSVIPPQISSQILRKNISYNQEDYVNLVKRISEQAYAIGYLQGISKAWFWANASSSNKWGENVMEEIKELFSSLSSQINKLDAKLDNLDNKYEIRINQLEQKFESKIDRLEQKQDKLSEKIETLTNTVINIDDRLKIIEKNIEYRKNVLIPTIINAISAVIGGIIGAIIGAFLGRR